MYEYYCTCVLLHVHLRSHMPLLMHCLPTIIYVVEQLFLSLSVSSLFLVCAVSFAPVFCKQTAISCNHRVNKMSGWLPSIDHVVLVVYQLLKYYRHIRPHNLITSSTNRYRENILWRLANTPSLTLTHTKLHCTALNCTRGQTRPNRLQCFDFPHFASEQRRSGNNR